MILIDEEFLQIAVRIIGCLMIIGGTVGAMHYGRKLWRLR